MLVTHQKIIDHFKDEQNLFYIWNEDDYFMPNGTFGTVEYVSMFIATSGTLSIETEQISQKAGICNLQFFLPGTNIKLDEVSEDYHSRGIIYSSRFWDRYLIHSHPYTLLAQIYSCLSIKEKEKQEIFSFLSFLEYAKKEGKTDDNPVMQSLLLGIYSLVGKCYESWIADYLSASKVKLIANFSQLVYANYLKHRDVKFYADQLNISVTYFSQILKKLIGITPYRCIEKFIILKICERLTETDKCIKEIAFEFNFEDTSHFCKYFKKNMEISPYEFRKRRMEIMDDKFIL